MTRPTDAERVHAALLAAFTVVFAGLEGARVESRPGYAFLVCPPVPFPQFNGVWAERDGGARVAELGKVLGGLSQMGLQPWLQTREGRHPLVEREAGRLGLEMIETVPGMVCAASKLAVRRAGGVEIERVVDALSLAHAEAVAEAGFGVPPGSMGALYTQRLAAAPAIAYYLGRVGRDAVSTAIGVTCAESVGVFNVATVPQCRGRGYGMALTSRAVQDGVVRGAQLAWLQASPLGEPVYRRMGFRQVETYNLFSRG